MGKALIILSVIFLVSSCTYRHYLIPDDVWNESLKVTGVAAVLKRLNNSVNLIRGNKTYDVTVTEIEPRK